MIAFLIPILFLTGCPQPESGGSPFALMPEVPQKKLLTNETPVEAVCYVDVSAYNPLNAKDYVFSASADTPETPFFNYVVLGYAYLSKDARGYTSLEMTAALRHVLENSTVYIKPLHLKGIQALVEIRSGRYNDEKDAGLGVGFGTMDMAAINELVKEFKLLINRYGIDGFYFNDIGGGKNAYPPFTRNLTQFQSNLPLYKEELFLDDNGNALSTADIDEVLWREGGSNFSNLIQRTNEALKETYTSVWKNGSQELSQVQALDRILLVRSHKHGNHLLSQLRMEYMPDAYSGADPKVTGNLRFIVNDTPYDYTKPHAPLWNETQGREDVGREEAENVYIPFAVDLSAPKNTDETGALASAFLYKDMNPDSSEPSSYGGLFFSNLKPVSEAPSTAAYLSAFSAALFGSETLLAEDAGAGDYRKTW
jgi:hypothetical protein